MFQLQISSLFPKLHGPADRGSEVPVPGQGPSLSTENPDQKSGPDLQGNTVKVALINTVGTGESNK